LVEQPIDCGLELRRTRAVQFTLDPYDGFGATA